MSTTPIASGSAIQLERQTAVGTIAICLSSELRRFSKRHGQDPVTKLALELDSERSDLILAVDTAHTPGWQVASFRYPRVATLHQRPEWPPVAATVRIGGPRARAWFVDAVCVALLSLRSIGALDELRPAPAFEVLVLDRGEAVEVARARLASLSAVIGV